MNPQELEQFALKAGFKGQKVVPRANPRKKKIVALLASIAALSSEGLAIYNPLPMGIGFHECTSKMRIADGPTRSGKTQAAAAETARALLGCDPYDKFVKRNGYALIAGRDADHLATMWAKLSEQGSFQKIRDEHTGAWRSVRWDVNHPKQLDPYDEAYREKWQDGPPLIPSRCISRVSYVERGRGIPRIVEFTSGWKSLWRSGEGSPPRGTHYTFAWFDELLKNDKFFSETMRGLVALGETLKHTPKFVWSAAAQDCDLQLEELRRRSDEGDPDVGAFQFMFMDNPYVPEVEKTAFFNSLSRDERDSMIFGLYARRGKMAYSSYDPMGDQSCEPFPIPDDWCRYVVLDPGRQNCGTLLIAIPPDESHAYVYDGFLLRHGDADSWADEIVSRQGNTRFQAFIIDKRAGKQHSMGNSLRVCDLYWNALEERGIKPSMLGQLGGFYAGSDIVEAREETLVGWMNLRAIEPHIGTCRLQVFRGRLTQLDEQIRMAYYATPDKRADNKKTGEDLLVCLEYIAGFDPGYYPPQPLKGSTEDAFDTAFKKKLKQLTRGRQNIGVPIA